MSQPASCPYPVPKSPAWRPAGNRVRAVAAAVCIGAIAIALGKAGVDGSGDALGVLREWHYDGAPIQLHPGDLGWFWRFGAEATAAAVRTWSRDG